MLPLSPVAVRLALNVAVLKRGMDEGLSPAEALVLSSALLAPGGELYDRALKLQAGLEAIVANALDAEAWGIVLNYQSKQPGAQPGAAPACGVRVPTDNRVTVLTPKAG